MSKLEAPRLEEFLDQVGDFPSSSRVIDAEVRVDRVQGAGPGNGDPQHGWLSVFGEEVLSICSEELTSHVLIEFGPMRQVMVEAVDQTAPRKREMHLPLAPTGGTARSVVPKDGRQPVRNFVPYRMRR